MTTPPSAQSALVDSAGRPMPSWMRFFQDLAGSPAPIGVIAVPGSPFSYKAGARGTLSVGTATITDLSLRRARVSVPLLAAAGLVPMSKGDVVTMSFTGAAPSVSFVPA